MKRSAPEKSVAQQTKHLCHVGIGTNLAMEAPNDHNTSLRKCKTDSTPALYRGNPFPLSGYWVLFQ
jgi:hypothetical protein